MRPTHGGLRQRASQPCADPDAGCPGPANHAEWDTTGFRRPRTETCDWGLRTHPRECFPGLKGQGRCPVSPWKGTSLCGISGQVGADWMVTEPQSGFLVSAARKDTGGSTQPHAYLVSGQPCALLVSGQVWTDVDRLEHVCGDGLPRAGGPPAWPCRCCVGPQGCPDFLIIMRTPEVVLDIHSLCAF